ncbi:hypothetical protein FPV67DRAFT_588179 [Lyophyllum atratum]|nr:hypothetical protein FPV67DRAFT_588179 [Lyophyllum atratum]
MIRVYERAEVESLKKGYSREAILWRQLAHPNLLPFMGLGRLRYRFCFVSPWIESGHVHKYLAKNTTASRLLLLRRRSGRHSVSPLKQGHPRGPERGACGCPFLAGLSVLRRAEKANILVTDSARACVADFRLSSVTDSEILHWTSQSSPAGKGVKTRGQAPELREPLGDKATHMCMLRDFYRIHSVLRISLVINIVRARGRQPPRSSAPWTEKALRDSLWMLMEDGWRKESRSRPRIDQIVSRLPEGVMNARSAASWMDSVTHSQDLSSRPLSLTIINAVLYHERTLQPPETPFSPPPPRYLPPIIANAAEAKDRRTYYGLSGLPTTGLHGRFGMDYNNLLLVLATVIATRFI